MQEPLMETVYMFRHTDIDATKPLKPKTSRNHHNLKKEQKLLSLAVWVVLQMEFRVLQEPSLGIFKAHTSIQWMAGLKLNL